MVISRFRSIVGTGMVALLLAVLLSAGATPALAQTPTLGAAAWTSSMGGALTDEGFGLVVDGAGNVIVTGSFQGSADFDPGAGTKILSTLPGSVDAYVAKLNAQGDLVWAVRIGGSETTVAHDVAVDSGGDIYVVGSFQGETDFDPGPAQRNITSQGSTDIFLLRLDPAGNLVRVTTLGSDESDEGLAIAVDWRGHIYITGSFEESMEVGIDPNGGDIALESEGADDVFVIRYANQGALLRAWVLGGDQDDVGRDIVVDAAGNVYVAGDFEDKIDFDPDLDYVKRSAGDEDVFVAMYNDAADFKWAAVLGGLEEDERPDISIDSAGNVYVTGNFESTADFDPGPGEFPLTSLGEEDIFLVKLSNFGALVWAKAIGGLDSDRGEGIVVDPNGDVFVTGSFKESVDFDPGAGQFFLTSAGEKDVFLSRYSSSGQFYSAQAMRGELEDVGHAIALDKAQNVYVAGSFQGTVDFNAGAEPQVRTSAGDSDIFLAKRSPVSAVIYVLLIRDPVAAAGQ